VLQRVTSKFWFLRQFISSAAHRGWKRTLAIAAYELWYERKFHANTGVIVPAEQLDVDAEARSHSRDYFPSSYLFIHEALSQYGFDWRGRTFIDFGCGMGRVLLVASDLPFEKIIGVELSPSLAAVARQNLARHYKASSKITPAWSIEVIDARQYDIPESATVFYFFNPFDAAVLGETADRIIASIRRAPRDCFVIYIKPVYETVFMERGFVRLAQSTSDTSVFSYAAWFIEPHTTNQAPTVSSND